MCEKVDIFCECRLENSANSVMMEQNAALPDVTTSLNSHNIDNYSGSGLHQLAMAFLTILTRDIVSVFTCAPTVQTYNGAKTMTHGLGSSRCPSYVLFFLTFLIFPTGTYTQGINVPSVNVALGKTISANLTCGTFGPELYVGHNQTFITPSQRVPQTCFNNLQHRPEFMVDGNILTWWQSASREILVEVGYGTATSPDSWIRLDLEEGFDVDQIEIMMGDAKRAGRTEIYRSFDGANFRPWIYRVSGENDCNDIYQIALRSVPLDVNSPICGTYGVARLQNYETLTFDLSDIPDNLRTFRNVRWMQINFNDIDLTLGINGKDFQHYAVREIRVMAQCMCNGHNTACNVNPLTGKYECVCGGNTQGHNCEECQPFFNQMPFTYGQPCQACQCFGHANTCYFNATAAAVNQSLNAFNQRIGGGVCQNCNNNTAGINCEKCVPYFYRPLGVPQTDPNACIPCNCNGPGVRLNFLSGQSGDCVMNDDLLPPGMSPGDCFCKANVTGPRCDTCKPGHYNLQLLNSDGCQACQCNLAGTVMSSPVCNANSSGVCPCKLNVQNRNCDTCKDGYYGLNVSVSVGCLACGCDPGGSLNTICNKITGQCVCRRNLTSRTCSEVDPGYYFPDLHSFSSEFERLDTPFARTLPDFLGFGYVTPSAGSSVSTQVTTPCNNRFQGLYKILLRYSSPNIQLGTMVISSQFGQTAPVQLNINACLVSTWCYLQVDEPTLIYFSLTACTTYTITVTVDGSPFLDRVVLLPMEYIDSSNVLGLSGSSAFQLSCDLINNNMNNNLLCWGSVLSLSTFYHDGALPCECHPLGTNQSTPLCNPRGGQCTCMPGVMGRRCDECMLEYYNLGPAGCQHCSCEGAYKICDSTTGQCLCPPNIIGRACDVCAPSYWKYNSTTGCEACSCDPVGSLSLQCNLTTGVCQCRNGVAGDKCNQCQTGYKSLTINGCEPCGCDLAGSINGTCTSEDGKCTCKANTDGQRCDYCKPGSYYLNADHAEGCLDCVCMGVSNTCRSTTLRYSSSLYSLLNASGSPTLQISDGQSTRLATITTTTFENVQMLQTEVAGTPPEYWVVNGPLGGNQIMLYGSTVSFKVLYRSSVLTGTPQATNAILVGRNGVRYVLKTSTVVRQAVLTDINVTLSIQNLVEGQPNATRKEFLIALSDVSLFLLPASFQIISHTTSIGQIIIQMPDFLGTGALTLSVEQCTCPIGYDGLSCEKCSFGYMRTNVTTQGYLGLCARCQCNNHAASCDPNTGQCISCEHNTAGFNCEVCSDGFYGNARVGTAVDCIPCPCYQPRVNASTCLSNGSRVICQDCMPGYVGDRCDQCAPFYYGSPLILGGTCNQCSCNNNALTCDPSTGQCLNCGFNTTGPFCESCLPGFYGNGSTQSCKPCSCSTTGSSSPICDSLSGNCTCYEGIMGRTCDRCMPNYYGFNNFAFFGCVPCLCNEFGSQSHQCNDTNGVCSCLANAMGDKCDRCAFNFFGLPTQSCAACGCNPTGTVDLNQPCNLFSGQCSCKIGVEGRTCDRCQRLYTNFGIGGCESCGDCQFALGNNTKDLQDQWQVYWNETMKVGAIQTQDILLQSLSNEIDLTIASLGASEDQLNSLTSSVNTLITAESNYNLTLRALFDRVDDMEARSGKMENDSSDVLASQREFQVAAHSALDLANSMNLEVQTIINRLEFYNSTSFNLLIEASGTYTTSIVNETFADQQQLVAWELGNLTVTGAAANSMRDRTYGQANLTQDLQNATSTQQATLTALEAADTQVEQNITNIGLLINNTFLLYNDTKNKRDYAEILFLAAQEDLKVTEVQNRESTFKLNMANNNIKDAGYIYSGSPNGLLPVSGDINLAGLTSWLQASNLLEQQLNASNTALTTHISTVASVEQKTTNLTRDAKALSDQFNTVKSKGEQAVQAIKNFEAVAATLNETVELAKEANATIRAAQAATALVSIADLEAQAIQSETASRALQQTAATTTYDSLTLGLRMTEANISLHGAAERWRLIDNASAVFYSSVENIRQLSQNPQVAPFLTSAKDAALRTQNTASLYYINDKALEQQMANVNGVVTAVRDTVTQGNELKNNIDTELTAFNQNLETSIQGGIDRVNAMRNETSATRFSIEAKLAALEAVIAQAEAKLLSLGQPVSFFEDTYCSMDNPTLSSSSRHTILEIDFQTTQTPQGVLFFAENSLSVQFFAVEIVSQQLVFKFNNGNELITIISDALLCPGCWFRVIASKYGPEGHLTVIRISTGGVATNFLRGTSAQQNLQINSKMYVGGLPANYLTNKVSNLAGFVGCVNNARFNGYSLPLWAKALEYDSVAECCTEPPEPFNVPRDPLCVPLDGWNGIVVNNTGLDVTFTSHVSLQFRTWDRSGVILMIDQPLSNLFWSLVMFNGRVSFRYGQAGAITTVTSAKTYNDGKWYQVQALHNSTNAQVSVRTVDPAVSVEVDVMTVLASTRINLFPLSTAQLTFGGQNPFTGIHGTVTDGFAGSIKQFYHSRGLDITLYPATILDKVSYTSVPLKRLKQGCIISGTSGIGFRSSDSYAALTNMPPVINTLEFQFQTFQSTGVLVYGQRAFSTDTYIYVGLYNGDVLLLYNQRQGVQGPIRSLGQYLSDGQFHAVRVDLTSRNTPRLTVDGVVIHGNYLNNPGELFMGGGNLYMGGIARNINLPIEMPTSASLIAGIRELKINGAPYDLFSSATLRAALQVDTDLSAIYTGPTFLPPPPFTTTVAPPTVAPPTCASPSSVIFSNAGVRFGQTFESYMYFLLNKTPNIFNASFTITMEFRAVQPNGILVYAASSVGTNPIYYLALFLDRGYLVFNMQDFPPGQSSKQLRSKFDGYDDGTFWKVTVLRINKFLAMVVSQRRDYKNNDGNPNATSTLTINTPLYVGGVPRSLQGPPFVSQQDINIGNVPFKGCVRSIQVATHKPQPMVFDVTRPDVSLGVMQCFDSAQPGVFLNGTGAYIRLNGPFNINPGFVFNMTFRSTVRNAILMSSYVTNRVFILMEIYEGQIRVIMSDGNNVNLPFVAMTSTPSTFSICDNEQHRVLLTIDATAVSIALDLLGTQVFRYPGNFGLMTLTSASIYVGGMRNINAVYPIDVNRQSLIGCIEDIYIRSIYQDLTETTDKNGAMSGCPGS